MKIINILFLLFIPFISISANDFQSISKDILTIRKALQTSPKYLVDPLSKIRNWKDSRVLISVGGKYKVIEMISEYKNYDFRKRTKYFDQQQRDEREVFIDNTGSFYRKKSRELIKGIFSQRKEWKEFIYVMDKDGKIYLELPGIDKHVVNFHHSSFMAGGPVASAGAMVLDSNGKLLALSVLSGHYRPIKGMIDQVINELRQRGVNYNFMVLDLGTAVQFRPTGWWQCCSNH